MRGRLVAPHAWVGTGEPSFFLANPGGVVIGLPAIAAIAKQAGVPFIADLDQALAGVCLAGVCLAGVCLAGV